MYYMQYLCPYGTCYPNAAFFIRARNLIRSTNISMKPTSRVTIKNAFEN